MGVAALVLGIISLVLSLIPIIGVFGLGLSIVGLILGIIDWVQKKKTDEKHGQAMAGVICSAVAIVIVVLYTVLFGAVIYNVVENTDEESVHDFLNSMQELDENEDINFSFDINNITNL